MNRASWLLLGIGVVIAGLGGRAAAQGTVVELDGLKAKTPAEWKEKDVSPIQRQMGRYKYFVLPRVDGDKFDAEVYVFHFGGGQGGSLKDNVTRWKGMFVPPQGKSIEDATKVDEFKVGAAPITYVDIQGTYKFKKAPMIPDDRAELRPDHRMVAVFFDSKGGPYFFRFVGPAKSVAHYKDGFDKWLKSFE